MKKMIGVVVFVALGLFAFTREAPAAQAGGDDVAVRAPQSHGCPPSRPFCCEPDEDGCYACIGPGESCP